MVFGDISICQFWRGLHLTRFKSKLFITINILVFLFAQSIAFGNEPKEITYEFKKKSFLDTKILIKLKFIGNKSGQTIICLPSEWAGQVNLFENIENIKILYPKEASLHNTKTAYIKKIIHRPGEKVIIQYQLKSGSVKKTKEINRMYIPIIEKDYFHFNGRNALIAPFVDNNIKIKVHFKWDFPKKWNVVNSYGCGIREQVVNTTSFDVLTSLYVGGNLNLINGTESNCENIIIILRGKLKHIDHQKLNFYCNKIITSQNKFWGESKNKYFLIDIFTVNGPPGIFTGTAFLNAFTLVLPENLPAIDADVLRLISHEYFHKWNTPSVFNYDGPIEDIYWFTEGITDYYSNLFLLRENLISLNEYVDYYNYVLKSYYMSSVKNCPNKKTKDLFWKNVDIEKLPYQRGNILAHNWNTKIKEKSNNKFSLDFVIKKTIKNNDTKDVNGITLTNIEKNLNKYISNEATKDIKKYIYDGSNIIPDDRSLGSCCSLTQKQFSSEKKGNNLFYVPQFILDQNMIKHNFKECINWFHHKD